MAITIEERDEIVCRAAAAVCFYCGNDKWMPASWDDGDYYHQPVKGKAGPVWCEANCVYHEFWDDDDQA